MHALAWIGRHGRFLRSISARVLRQKTQRPTRSCTWCGSQVRGRRVTWCSDDCVDAYQAVCQPGWAKWAVFRRDKGVCVRCGLHTWDLTKILLRAGRTGNALTSTWRGKTNRRGRKNRKRFARRWALAQLVRAWLKANGFDPYTSLWEMDHILEVSRGGGLCGLTGYQTLCQRCHLAKPKAGSALSPARKVSYTERQLEQGRKNGKGNP